MNYQDALREMRELCSPAISPGLERIRALMAQLGHPERDLRAIHVGGTNGKGSVCAMLDAMLLAQGFSTGRFTSPHLHDYRERYLINGAMLSEEQSASLLKHMIVAIRALLEQGGPRPSEFEASTALSLLAMAEAQVDWAIMEVGMGGRWDATNVVKAPLAIITNIGRDHMEYLGESIPEIAAEKAGIIKAGAHVFTGAAGQALDTIIRRSEAYGARLSVLGQDIHCQGQSHDFSGQTLDIQTSRAIYPNLHLPLLGAHQGLNAALAVAAAEEAGVEAIAMRQGLAEVHHPARLEIISRQPLILLDGAHNMPGIATLARALEDYWPGRRVLALVGMLADKEREQALSLLLPRLAGIIISRPPLLQRSEDWQSLAEICASAGMDVPPQNILEEVEQACQRALKLLPGYDMLLVCGSLYLVAQAREHLLEKIPANLVL